MSATRVPEPAGARPTDRFEWERAVLGDPEITSTTTVTVALALATYSDGKTGRNVRPGEKTLAGDTRLGRSTVRKHVDLLRVMGYLHQLSRGSGNRHGGGGRASEYRLTLPNTATPVAVTEIKDRSCGSSVTDQQRSPEAVTPLLRGSNAATPVAPIKGSRDQEQPRGHAHKGAALDDATAAVAAHFACSHEDAGSATAALLARRRGGPPEHPASWVKSVLRENPDRLRALLPAAPIPRLPPPCGECEARPDDAPSARFLANGARCPRCHPAALLLAGGRRAS